MPQVNIQTNPEIKLFEVHYIGRCKDRGGEKAAFGMLADGSWGVIFPEAVLRAWFEVGEPLPMELNTLYAVLGVARQATGEEIKTGYRRMAKAWHPDLNRGDPDAADQFRRVQEAWEILSIPRMRARYDAGLRLEASMERSLDTQYLEGYRAPLRCGLIMAEGVEKLGRFAVSKIMEWQDIYNDAGQMLVVSWPMGAKEPVENWV
ncbi:MAG: J domain-containing protein [Anaerohalosphaeraceae bacterium]